MIIHFFMCKLKKNIIVATTKSVYLCVCVGGGGIDSPPDATYLIT